jgi:hypothetical protein
MNEKNIDIDSIMKTNLTSAGVTINGLTDNIYNYYTVFIDIFKHSSISDKILLFLVRMIHIIIIIFVLIGFVFPKNILIWHCLVSFITLYILDTSKDGSFINNLTYTILKRNNKNNIYSDDELLMGSKIVSFNKKTCKIIILVLMMLSLIGYIMPKYSVHSLLTNINNKLDKLNKRDDEANDQKISPEFRFNKVEQGAKQIYKEEHISNSEQSIDNMVVELDNYAPLNIDIKTHSTDIDIDNQDIRVFDNVIEPIKVEITNKETQNISKQNIIGNEKLVENISNQNIDDLHLRLDVVTESLKNTHITNNQTIDTNKIKNIYTGNNQIIDTNKIKNIDKETLRKSLRTFNDIIL